MRNPVELPLKLLAFTAATALTAAVAGDRQAGSRPVSRPAPTTRGAK
jgi:hypothetical protein